jgi:hypothetical protein
MYAHIITLPTYVINQKSVTFSLIFETEIVSTRDNDGDDNSNNNNNNNNNDYNTVIKENQDIDSQAVCVNLPTAS